MFSSKWHQTQVFIFSYLHGWDSRHFSLDGQCLHEGGKPSVFPRRWADPSLPGHLSFGAPLKSIGTGRLWASCVFLALPSCSQKPPHSCPKLTQLLLLGCTMMDGGWLGGGKKVHVSMVLLFLLDLDTMSIDNLGWIVCFFSSPFVIFQVGFCCLTGHKGKGRADSPSVEPFVQCWQDLECCGIFAPFLYP